MSEADGTVPLPPPDATVKTTCCEYCPVACGYKVYTWPVGQEGGDRAHQNALGRSFPLRLPEEGWPTPNMHNVIDMDGIQSNVLIVPDADARVVNVGGTHSVRGGALAQKLYVKDSPTGDRLLEPMLRVNGTLQPISWDLATDIVAQVGSYVIDQHGPNAWGMKRYSYGGHENVTAITKLAYRAIGSANHSPHHAPTAGDDAPGLSDVGIDAFSASFEDDKQADVLFISGTDPYETKTVRFVEWSVKGGATIVYVDPRKTFTAAYALKNGGMHLQLKIGTDVVLYGAIARYILDQGWQDSEFVGSFVSDTAEIAGESSWRRRLFGASLAEFQAFLANEADYELANAAAITGVAAADIQEAARVLSGGNQEQPKTTILFEKGVYWTHIYENTAAIGNLALLLGATGRPGRAISRLGGHQRGGQSAGGYPKDASPDEFMGNKIELDTDRYFAEGNTRLMWAIGVNWVGASACSGGIVTALQRYVRDTGPQVGSVASAIADLKARVDAGGTVFIHQEIYENRTTDFADLVLPAAAWGEKDFARANAERRLRLYQKFMDPPGQARDDWEIVAEVARKMGYSGFEWANVSELFEESAGYSAGSRRDFSKLAEKAQADGIAGHEALRLYGTEGIQTPIRELGDGSLAGTERLHTDLRFKTTSGKAMFIKADWPQVQSRNNILAPQEGQVWVTNMRLNHLWNNLSDFTRRPYAIKRWPANVLQVNPEDAAAQSIQSGDLLRIASDNVIDQLGQLTSASFEAVALVTDEVPPGTTCSYFQYPGSFANGVVPGDTSLQPMTPSYHYKMGRGTVTKIGVWDGEPFPLEPRNLA